MDGHKLVSSFQVIGGIFDRVHDQASLTIAPLTDAEITLLPPGGVTMVEFRADYPGNYTVVDRALSCVEKGLAAVLTVKGIADLVIFDTKRKSTTPTNRPEPRLRAQLSIRPMNYDIRFKRIYEPFDPADGARILVDRLWPRGKRREDLQLTDWGRNAAPSTSLRRAWHKGQIDAETFANEYRHELDTEIERLVPLMRYARKGTVSLLTAVRNPENSHLPVLRDALVAALQQEDTEAGGTEPSSPVCYRT